MKKLLASILAFLVCSAGWAFASCGHEPPPDETPPTEQQIWLPYTMLDHLENCRRTYTYDAYGNETTVTKEDLNGAVLATWISEYDEHQNLIRRSVDTGKGEPFVQLIQVYDPNGNLTERQEINTNGKTVYSYQYDDANRLISRSSGGQIIESYIYEADGSYRVQKTSNADEYSLYLADGRIRERHFASNRKWTYTYDGDGNLLECTVYSGKDVIQRTVYRLDENGNAVTVSQIDASGKETVVGEYEYRQYSVTVTDAGRT